MQQVVWPDLGNVAEGTGTFEQTPGGSDQTLSLTSLKRSHHLSQGSLRITLLFPGITTLFQDLTSHEARRPLRASTSPWAQSRSAGHRLACGSSTSPASYFLVDSKLTVDPWSLSRGAFLSPPPDRAPLIALMRQEHHGDDIRLYWGHGQAPGKPGPCQATLLSVLCPRVTPPSLATQVGAYHLD